MYEVNKGYIFSEFQWLTATLIKVGNVFTKVVVDNTQCLLIVQFQKISIPTPQKVIGNSKGVGGLESQTF